MMTRREGITLACLCLSILAVSASPAATLVVHQDGSGDFTTIAAAIAAAADGDLVLIGPGTYDEILDVSEDLDLESELGAGSTVIDGANTHRIMVIDGAATVNIRGLTFTRAAGTGAGYHGGAIFISQGSQVDISDCAFHDNFANWDNGAVHARNPGTVVTITNSSFVDNSAGHNGGAAGVTLSASLTLDGCEFVGNSCDLITGAVNAWNALALNVYDCLFRENSAVVGAIIVESTIADIVGNTFYANHSTGHASVLFYSGSSGSFTRNIVAGDTSGYGLRIYGGSCAHGCNLYDGNALGAILGDDLQPDEVAMPALFCDAEGGDFSLCADSFALAANNECGLMGAFGEGCSDCGVVMVEARSWSQVKDLYR